MTDINTTIAEVKRLDAEATPGEWRAEADPGTDCEACLETSSPQAALVRSYHSAGGIAVVLTDDREKANAALIAYYRTAAPLLAAEVERLRAEVAAATDHVRALVAAMAEWGTWEDGVPAAGRDSGHGTVGDRYDAARAYLAAKGGEHE
jgi:hypothetical protein